MQINKQVISPVLDKVKEIGERRKAFEQELAKR